MRAPLPPAKSEAYRARHVPGAQRLSYGLSLLLTIGLENKSLFKKI